MSIERGRAMSARKKPVRSAVAAVRELLAAVDASGLAAHVIADRAGMHAITLTNWRNGKRAPRISDLEAVAQAIGYRFVLQPAEPPVSDLTSNHD